MKQLPLPPVEITLVVCPNSEAHKDVKGMKVLAMKTSSHIYLLPPEEFWKAVMVEPEEYDANLSSHEIGTMDMAELASIGRKKDRVFRVESILCHACRELPNGELHGDD